MSLLEKFFSELFRLKNADLQSLHLGEIEKHWNLTTDVCFHSSEAQEPAKVCAEGSPTSGS